MLERLTQPFSIARDRWQRAGKCRLNGQAVLPGLVCHIRHDLAQKHVHVQRAEFERDIAVEVGHGLQVVEQARDAGDLGIGLRGVRSPPRIVVGTVHQVDAGADDGQGGAELVR